MLHEKPLTPEKQLLKLIEEPTARNNLNVAVLRHQGLSWFSLRAWGARCSFLKDRFRKWIKSKSPQRLDVKALNIILEGIVVVLGLSLIINFCTSLSSLKKEANVKLKIPSSAKQPEGSPEGAILRKQVSYYLEKISGRDIFKMGPKKIAVPSVEENVNAQASRIAEATQNLKLVGISWSNDPDAMIEDTRALKTFFVKRGQMIGEVRVQAIFKDRVILSYSGEEIELK